MTPATTLTFDDIKQPITEWALDYGIAPAVIIARLERGLPVEEAITKPMVTARGQKLTGNHLDRYIFGQRTAWQRDNRKVIRAAEKADRVAARAAENAARQEAKRLTKIARPKSARPMKPYRSPANAQRYAFDGKSLTIGQWAKEIGMSHNTIRSRLRMGWPIERILTESAEADAKARRYTFNGESLTAWEWGERTGISASIITKRLWKGWPIERALTEPAASRRGTVRCDSRLYTFDGRTMTLTQWATELGIRPHTLLKRLKNWSIEDAFTIPVDERKGRGRGVGRNSGENVRTGGHPSAQVCAKLEFSPE